MTTSHEHLDESGLIHMNGRVYDPRLGRFLSADPMVQQEYNLQNLNRYSYVLNNPLNATDPSGYFFAELFAMAANYFTSASFAQSVAMAAVSYASNGGIQFTYSSAEAFSYGQGAQRSLESQLFDSYDLGGNAQGLDQAKAQAHVSSETVTSGVSGTNVDPLASGSGTEFNGTETVSTTPTSNAASIDTVKKKKWRKAFGEDGKQITDIRKSGKPKWSDVAASGNVLDKLLKKSLNLDIEILEQNTTVWDKWEQVEVSETYKTTSNSLSNYQDKLIKATRPQLTGRTRWVDTGRVVNVELMDFRACPLSCSNSGGGVINGFTGGALGGGN